MFGGLVELGCGLLGCGHWSGGRRWLDNWREEVIWVVRCLEVWLGKDVGDLAVYFGLIEGGRSRVVRRWAVGGLGSGWVVTEIERVGGWSVCLGLCGGRIREAVLRAGFGGLACERLGD